MLNVINVQAKVSCTQWSTRIDIKARRQYWKARSYIALHSLSLSGLYISVTNSHPYPKSWKSVFHFYQTNSSLTCKTRCRVCKNVFISELDYRVLVVGVLLYYYITLLKHTIVKWWLYRCKRAGHGGNRVDRADLQYKVAFKVLHTAL